MKQLLVNIFFLSFFFTAVAQEKVYLDKDWKETDAANAEFYRTIEKKGDIYAIKDYYISGKLQFEGFARNTKDPLHNEGICIWYNEDGKIAQKVEFKDNKKNGLFILNYENGNAKVRAFYIDDKAEGRYTEHFPSGEAGNIANFVNDKIEGVFTQYRFNGDLIFKITHKNGLEDGPYEFYSYGKLEYKGTAKNGFQEGECLEYNPESGAVISKYTIKDKKLDGVYKVYDETGELKTEGVFKEGIPQSYKIDKVVRQDERYVIDMKLKNGVEYWKTYVNDILVLESFYENGIRAKIWKLYTEHKGELALEIDYTKANCDDGYIQQVNSKRFDKSFLPSDRFTNPFNFPVTPCINVKLTEIIPTNIGSSLISYYESISEEELQNAEEEKKKEQQEVIESAEPIEEEVEETVIESTENWQDRVCKKYKDYLTIMACRQLKNDIQYTLFTGLDGNSLKIIKKQDTPVENDLFIFYQDEDYPLKNDNLYLAISVSKKLKKAYKKGTLNITDIINFIKDDFIYYSETSSEEFKRILEDELKK